MITDEERWESFGKSEFIDAVVENAPWLRKRTRRQRKVLRRFIDVFDSSSYEADYADVRESNFDGLEHYLKYGFCEGRRLTRLSSNG